MISLSLFTAAFTVNVLVIIVDLTRLKIFSVCVTAPLPSFTTDQLVTSLSSSTPLFNLLTLQSLARQTATNSSTRCTLFSLSQPGGHPHNWKAVSKVCHESVNFLCTSITSIVSPKAPTPSSPPKLIPVAQISSPNMRRLAPVSGTKLEDITVPPSISPAKLLSNNIASFMTSLKKQPLLALFFKVKDDADIRAVFCKSQATIWSVDILSHLVANSIVEDKFGVVQKDLPEILTSLLTLDCLLLAPRKSGGVLEEDMKLKSELKGAVKAAIQRIAISFGEHIRAIPLKSEIRAKMVNYQQMLEV